MFTFPEKSMTDLGGGADFGEGRTGSMLRTKDWQAGPGKPLDMGAVPTKIHMGVQ